MRIVLDSYTKAETDDKFVKLVDARGVTVGGLKIEYGNPILTLKTTAQDYQIDFELDPSSTILNINGIKTGVGLEYRVQVPRTSGTLALTNNPSAITAYGFYATHPTGDSVIWLGDPKEGYDLVYARSSKRGFIRNNRLGAAMFFPDKSGTFAIQEDNYTKKDIDSKINAVKWTASKSTNGWMKDPSTGIIIQWGNIPKGVYSTTFPIRFPSTVFSAVSQCVNSNTTISPQASAIYDLSITGFNLRWGTLGGNAYAGAYTRWFAIGY
ncbi:hypothetical protein [Arsenophonus sp.]|nr:hypothetical protein [Arsenophonus sp.]MDR5610608.1 hypothetical protein [Arsenophonus sp.]MDR5614398.1 hypothetical protein [Arsenophonus sp.]